MCSTDLDVDTDAERSRLSALAPGAALVFRNGASNAEYEAALLGAHALVTTSWDEGFPVLEAMRVGTPVVASDIPIFHEVGGAAVLVDPSSLEDVARGIRLLEPADAWIEASRAGVAQAGEFTWAASARALLKILRSVAP